MKNAQVECVDVSGIISDGSKLELTVVSTQFNNIPLFKRRQIITECLNSLRCEPGWNSDIITYNLLPASS